ncbi:MAG: DUF456 domain-containing protein [Terracoccus sp.]
MITGSNLVVLLMMVVGTIGIVVPVLPGLLLVWAGTLLYAYEMHDTAGWVVFAVATLLYAAGLVAQYVLPGRRLRAAGVATPVIAVALAVGVLGFFVIPVVGAPIGFIGAIYLIERVTHRDHASAWRATTQALRAVVLNLGIELGTALAILTTWVVGVLVRG